MFACPFVGRSVGLIGCLSALVGTAVAQDDVPPLSLSEAESLAVEASPAVAAALAEVAAADARATADGSLPAAELTVQPLWSDERRLDVEAELSQVLFAPGLGAAGRAARLARLEARLALDEVRLTIAAEARAAWLELAAARLRLAAAEENVAVVAALRDAAAAARDVGERPGVDVLRAELELAEAEDAVAAARLAAAEAEVRLNLLLGREPTASVVIEPTLAVLPPTVGDDALAARPALQAAEVAIEAARATVSSVRARRLPTVEAGAFREDQEHGVRVSLNLPLFDYGRNRGESREAEAAVARAEAELARLRRELQSEAARAELAVAGELARRATYRAEVLARAERLVELARVGYETGAMSLLDVLDARRRLAAARAGVVDRDLGVALAVNDLWRAHALPPQLAPDALGPTPSTGDAQVVPRAAETSR